ncbi:hypothetical protein TSMEX_007003 [Taenia solium]|eukprot:TsM_000703300 transcript=TsM_000703300 gene=TsM_000703300
MIMIELVIKMGAVGVTGAIPGRVCYLFWVHILAPWIFDPNQSPQISEKKQKKQERRLKRMQNAGR